MGRLFIILLFCCWLASCSFRIYENGHFVTRQLPKSTSDSILIVSISSNAKIPESATEIIKTVIKAPFQIFIRYEKMVTYAKFEASKLGGNLIKVTNYHSLSGSRYLKQAIYSTVYKMNTQTLSNFKTQLDSIEVAYSDSIKYTSIVHIKDYDDQGEQSISFNNTLVAKIKGVGFDSVRKPGRKDLVFNQNGTLSIGVENFDINIGNEYFIILYTTFARHQIYYHRKLVDKDHFYYKL